MGNRAERGRVCFGAVNARGRVQRGNEWHAVGTPYVCLYAVPYRMFFLTCCRVCVGAYMCTVCVCVYVCMGVPMCVFSCVCIWVNEKSCLCSGTESSCLSLSVSLSLCLFVS